MAKTGIGPTGFTAIGLLVTALGAWQVAHQAYIVGALVVLLGASFDFVDGSVARATGRVTRAGGYLDSLSDRYADFVVLLGIGIALDSTTAWVVASFAMFGSLVTSYAKARVHETMTPPTDAFGGELAERPDRYVVLLPAIFFQGVIDANGGTVPLLYWGLVVAAVLTNLTVLQRMRTAMHVLKEEP